jgi:hypothetical protein
MSAVTYSTKRYIAACAGCDALFESQRKDQLTCSPGCRVKAHRSGALKELRSVASRLEIAPSIIKQAAALRLLRPDFEPKVLAGKLTLSEAMPDLCTAFDRLVMLRAKQRLSVSADGNVA